MSFTNHERGDDWEVGDAISIPVDLDDDPDLVLGAGSTDDDADEAGGA